MTTDSKAYWDSVTADYPPGKCDGKYSSLDSAKVQQRGWFTRADDMARTVEGYNATSLRVLRQGYADLAQQFNGLMLDIIGTEKTVQELRDKMAVQRGCYASLTAHNDQLQKEAVLDRDEIQRLRAAVDAANAFVAERETDKDKTIKALQEQLRQVSEERTTLQRKYEEQVVERSRVSHALSTMLGIAECQATSIARLSSRE